MPRGTRGRRSSTSRHQSNSSSYRRRATGGRRSNSNYDYDSGYGSALSRDLDSILDDVVPQIGETLQELDRANDMFGQDKPPKWGMEVVVEDGQKGSGAWPIDRIDTKAKVEKLFRKLVNKEQSSSYARFYSHVMSGSGGGGSVTPTNIFEKWAKDKRVDEEGDKLGANKDAMEYFLSGSAMTKVKVADAHEKAKAEAAKGGATDTVAVQVVKIQKEADESAKEATAKVAELTKLKNALDVIKKKSTQPSAKSMAALEAKIQKVTGEYETLSNKNHQLAGQLGALLDFKAGFIKAGSGYGGEDRSFPEHGPQGQRLTIGKNWSPYFTEKGFMCSPSNNLDGFHVDDSGQQFCDIDLGESGTMYNLSKLAELQNIENDRAEQEKRKRKVLDLTSMSKVVNGRLTQDMPRNWQWAPGNFGNWRTIMQPDIEMAHDQDAGMFIQTNNKPEEGRFMSDKAINDIPLDSHIFNSTPLALRKGKNGTIGSTRLLCEPLHPAIPHNGGWACAVATDPRFNDPSIRDKDGMYVEADPEHANLFIKEFEGKKVQYARMPPGWNPTNAGFFAHDQHAAPMDGNRLAFGFETNDAGVETTASEPVSEEDTGTVVEDDEFFDASE